MHWAVLAVLIAGCALSARQSSPNASPAWTSRAIPEARGDVRVEPDGKRTAIRYKGWTTRDFGAFRTYAYGDARPELAVQKAAMPAGVTGDPKKGRALFLNRTKGPCTGCHLVPGDDVWPAGSVGPDLSTFGDRKLPDAYVYQHLWDPRGTFPGTVMPPWGAAGVFTPEEIVHLIAYLQSLHGPASAEKDADRNPFTRRKPTGFGDNLDPTNNPAVVRAEEAQGLWNARGPAGKACADCHAGGPAAAMRGVATRYPRVVAEHGRVMSLEDFLTVHAETTTGRALPSEGAANLDLTVLIKMASNGMPVAVDTTSPAARAAIERGKATFFRRVGDRNHACADCHTPERGANKFLGGRFLADVTEGLTRHFPTWRTSQNDVWDMRKRMQWCMTPLGANMLAADAVEYAELELFLTTFDVGKPMSTPGIRH
ncbi:MAG TPA: sulfur oxidation c-type cytochrome SoxA [Methylomirabilota bacterium]|nr:sulfur oxidation c-type cytochrome SoxA [Methylomirabilota bacterium]